MASALRFSRLAPILLAASARADAHPLRWAVDSTGGAPYAFTAPEDPRTVLGFEAELIEAVARRAGEALGEPLVVTPVQGDFVRLADLVRRGDADIAMNGLEDLPTAALDVRRTRAYYAADLSWTVRTGEAVPRGDLAGLTIGSLPGTRAETLLEGGRAIVRTYGGGQGELFDDLLTGRTRAVLIDEPVARYYARRGVSLATERSSFPPTPYVALLPSAPSRLSDALASALTAALDSGDAAQIYARWGILNDATRALCTIRGPLPSATAAEHWDQTHGEASATTRWRHVLHALPALLLGLRTTLVVSVAAMLLAIALGLVLAAAQLAGARAARGAARTYIEIFRGTPVYLQLALVYFGLPELGVVLAPETAGIVALGLNYAASEAENFRAGVIAIPRTLLEAARALGLSRGAIARHIIGPLALRGALPPMTNDFLALLKDSALVSMVTVTELTRAFTTLATSTGAFLEAGAVASALYLLAGLPFAVLARRLEGHLGRRPNEERLPP